jgi:hypothetical protein
MRHILDHHVAGGEQRRGEKRQSLVLVPARDYIATDRVAALDQEAVRRRRIHGRHLKRRHIKGVAKEESMSGSLRGADISVMAPVRKA